MWNKNECLHEWNKLEDSYECKKCLKKILFSELKESEDKFINLPF